MELRVWQQEALASFHNSRTTDFLACATPGAGKTVFAGEATIGLIERNLIEQVVVIVPKAPLRQQWKDALHRQGIAIDAEFVNGDGQPTHDFDGVAVCYSSVAAQPALWRRLIGRRRTLVILDEVHHAGDNATWGHALTEATEGAVRRLSLTGTPFRTDGTRIPFVSYDPITRKCVPNSSYDYGTALQDGGVVRPIEFLTLDGHMKWCAAGSVAETSLADADDEAISRALLTAYNPKGDWIASAMRQGDAELSRIREELPEAGGLILAYDQEMARAYAALMESICGEQVPCAVSDDKAAGEVIKSFGRGTQRWLVAVQMVSEGVDIPRLAVGIYGARSYGSELFFRQVVGRFVRLMGTDDHITATLLIPQVAPLVRLAQRVEKEADVALAQREQEILERCNKSEGGAASGTRMLALVDYVSASEAVHSGTIAGGDTFPDEELKRAAAILEATGLAGASITAAQAARIGRAFGAGRVVGSAMVEEPQAPPLSDVRRDLRDLIHKKVGRLARVAGVEHKAIHVRLMDICGDSVKSASIDSLKQRIALLDEWISAGSLPW